ncbi:hypothetical protein GCM10023196_053220 [Actinoallomurus vinaceus]|uniref:Uncharacterized protein n=1 Tax=Actinoallomurus vinaceus TaxID=1080074 RepID=A0ABP8UE33_9ACTN
MSAQAPWTRTTVGLDRAGGLQGSGGVAEVDDTRAVVAAWASTVDDAPTDVATTVSAAVIVIIFPPDERPISPPLLLQVIPRTAARLTQRDLKRQGPAIRPDRT